MMYRMQNNNQNRILMNSLLIVNCNAFQFVPILYICVAYNHYSGSMCSAIDISTTKCTKFLYIYTSLFFIIDISNIIHPYTHICTNKHIDVSSILFDVICVIHSSIFFFLSLWTCFFFFFLAHTTTIIIMIIIVGERACAFESELSVVACDIFSYNVIIHVVHFGYIFTYVYILTIAY